MKDISQAWRYVIGYILSLGLTLTAYFAVKHHLATGHLSPTDNAMLAILSILAIAQLMAQLIFFLHLHRESKPFWNLQVLLFALTVVFILVFGSIWIMENLNYHHHGSPTSQSDPYIIHDEGIHQ